MHFLYKQPKRSIPLHFYSVFWGSENKVATQYPFIDEFLKKESATVSKLSNHRRALVDLLYNTEQIVDTSSKESSWVEPFHNLVRTFVLEKQKDTSQEQHLSDLIQKAPSPVSKALFHQLQIIKEMYWNVASISEWEQKQKQITEKYSLYEWGKEMYPSAGKRLKDLDRHLEAYSNYMMLITMGKQLQQSESKELLQVNSEKEHAILQQSEEAIDKEPSIALAYITRGIFQASKVSAANLESIEGDILRYLENFESDFVAREFLGSVYQRVGHKNAARDQFDLASQYKKQ